MKICLVTAFPPSGRQLNEYAFYVAREMQRDPRINLTILADELDNYEFATDENGKPLAASREEPAGFRVVRCWAFNDLRSPFRLLRTIRKIKPDVVWFNLVFSTFATPDHPVAAFAGLCVPALARALGCYAHITLHHILEHVDFAGAGVRQDRIFRLGSELATRVLLKSNSVSVLLSAYQRTLFEKYSAHNILLGTHGVFGSRPSAPDSSKRGNPDQRILAIGHWGTYKRLETLMEAFPAVLKRVPNARLVIAGANHHTKPGYWESIRDSQKGNSRIEFRGYVAEHEIPDLFRGSSIVVMPYDSATGSSGPAHQACEFGVPMVCADLADFRTMATDEEMAINFYKTGDAADLADKLAEVLESPELQHSMAEQNFSAAVRMTMPNVVRNYLRWFELAERKRALGSTSELQSFRHWSRQLRADVRRRSCVGTMADVVSEGEVIRIKSRAADDDLEGNAYSPGPLQSPE
jgi:glycosyltransferase involved in cell wall biosynthesis